MTSLFAKETEFWIWLSKDFWEDYAHPLFASDYHYFNEMVTWSPCSSILTPEIRVIES